MTEVDCDRAREPWESTSKAAKREREAWTTKNRTEARVTDA